MVSESPTRALVKARGKLEYMITRYCLELAHKKFTTT